MYNTAKSFSLSLKISLARLALRTPDEFALPRDVGEFEKREVLTLLSGLRSAPVPPRFDPAVRADLHRGD